MLELSPAFSDTTFEEIALDCSLEHFFRYGNQNPAKTLSVVSNVDITDMSDVAMSSFGKKSFNAFLAAQSFFFRKSIWRFLFHFRYLER